MNQPTLDTKDRLRHIKLLLLDCDGVLTGGSITFDDRGRESKAFNIKDGLGIRLLLDAGIGVGVVTGRRSGALRQRCADLGIDLLYEGVADKKALLETVTGRTGINPGNIAFMGDDLPDLQIMKRVGLAVAVSDAVKTVRERAAMVTVAKGGRGAVREICEAILDAQGLLDSAISRFNG